MQVITESDVRSPEHKDGELKPIGFGIFHSSLPRISIPHLDVNALRPFGR